VSPSTDKVGFVPNHAGEERLCGEATTVRGPDLGARHERDRVVDEHGRPGGLCEELGLRPTVNTRDCEAVVSTTSPAELTRMRSETEIMPKWTLYGTTQKGSVRSRSLAVMWPARPSLKPKREKSRRAVASYSFR